MANFLDTLRQKQQRVVQIKAELAQLEAELRDARAILSGRSTVAALPGLKPKSRHGFTQGKRAKPIQHGSSVWWTQRVLEEAGKPVHIDKILATIEFRGGGKIKKPTLISNLSRYIKHGDTFTRPATSVYGLVAFGQPNDEKEGVAEG